ncbi:CRISPR-associated protein Cas5 [Klebsiella pneumoniae]|uniref:CRISPR-associated protein Cas5 n=1 Tax=Klebsiella pneumoniae TaxID=573 RepID=UPI003305694B
MLLWLEGPLQSWGGDSKFGVRDTLNFSDSLGHSGADLLCTRRRGARGRVAGGDE